MGNKWLRNSGNSQAKFSDAESGEDTPKSDPMIVARVQQKRVNSVIEQLDKSLDKRDNRKFVRDNGGISFRQAPSLNLNADVEGDLSGLDNSELIVVDPKRRRLDLDKKDKDTIQDQDTNMETHDIQGK